MVGIIGELLIIPIHFSQNVGVISLTKASKYVFKV